jgi:hypothetical protein
MPLYIRDDKVKELASQVAALQRSTVTDAVRDALKQRLNQLEEESAEQSRRIDEFLAALDAEPDLAPGFTDKDLYDENGDPILGSLSTPRPRPPSCSGNRNGAPSES